MPYYEIEYEFTNPNTDNRNTIVGIIYALNDKQAAAIARDFEHIIGPYLHGEAELYVRVTRCLPKAILG